MQWHQLDRMQTICTSHQTDNHTNTSSLNFYWPDALSDAQPTVSKHIPLPLRPKTPSSFASFKSRLVLLFWYRLTRVVLEKRLLNGCVRVVCVLCPARCCACLLCSKVKYRCTDIAVRSLTCHATTGGAHVPYRTTQCYLPPDRADIPAFTPSRSWYSINRPRRDARLS